MITGHTIPKKVLMMEPDMVWDKEQLKKALELTDPEISFKQMATTSFGKLMFR